MKSREYGVWPPRNGLGAERQKLYDEFNRAHKGEAFLRVEEYADSNVEEYYRVPMMKDVSGDPNKQDYEAITKNYKKKERKNPAAKRQRVLQQVVGVLVGAVVIVTTYQSMKSRGAQIEPEPELPVTQEAGPSTGEPGGTTVKPALTEEWTWSEDGKTAVLTLKDENGAVVAEKEAEITVSVEEATCTKPGASTATASAEAEGETYTDERTEELPALGHDFGEGREVVLASGETAYEFECDRCHELFTIVNSVSEN